jgi:hypothetical protein
VRASTDTADQDRTKMPEPLDHSGHRLRPTQDTADQAQADHEKIKASDDCKIGQGGTENVRELAGGMAMAMQAWYGEVGLDDIFNSEFNGGKGRNNKNKTLIFNREVKIENQQFEMANSKGLELRNDNEQGDGNCEQMVGTFGQKANFRPKFLIWNVLMRMKWNGMLNVWRLSPKKKRKRVLPS